MSGRETRRARLRAFAKINLTLEVLGKRPDGFHELRTISHTISLADRIEVEFTPARRTQIALRSSVAIAGNIVERAARAVLEALGTGGHLRIRLYKRIPIGAGLGGGSSDAAAVLLALPVLAGQRLPVERLHGLAAGLGSDVPFFLSGGSAIGFGRGTEVYPLGDLPATWGVLVTPGIHVPTAEAYLALGRPELTMRPEFNIMDSFQALAWNLAAGSSSRAWAAFCRNDFAKVVFSRYPLLRRLGRRLEKSGARPALMSGSGSSLFGIFTSRAEAVQACLDFPPGLAEPFTLVSRSRYRSHWWRSLQEHTDEKLWPPRTRRETRGPTAP